VDESAIRRAIRKQGESDVRTGKDPIGQRWVIVSGEAKVDPRSPRSSRSARKATALLPGNEAMTPPDILTMKDPATGAWTTRVIPNKFPALQIEGVPGKRGTGIYDLMNGIGAPRW
jgi:UDPglucose--hexose-1-phosphate uridylyltransferase